MVQASRIWAVRRTAAARRPIGRCPARPPGDVTASPGRRRRRHRRPAASTATPVAARTMVGRAPPAHASSRHGPECRIPVESGLGSGDADEEGARERRRCRRGGAAPVMRTSSRRLPRRSAWTRPWRRSPPGSLADASVVATRAPSLRTADARSAVQLVSALVMFVAGWVLALRLLDVHYALSLVGSTLIAVAVIRCFIIFHDCGHGSFSRSRAAQRRRRDVARVLVFTPFRHWNYAHVLHHATSSDLDRRGVRRRVDDDGRGVPRGVAVAARGTTAPTTARGSCSRSVR